ncbi:MAG: hypothetical protein ORN85_10410 [Sediminibacterium sp.]|nr:hypothetical protein [Sediminibacterium sp.]
MEQWVTVFKSATEVEINIVCGHLNNLEIPNQVLNKKDSTYIFLGEGEVKVPESFKLKALEEIKTLNFS